MFKKQIIILKSDKYCATEIILETVMELEKEVAFLRQRLDEENMILK